MFFDKSARILGRFEGKITAKGEVQIGATAECHAAVEAERIIVDGGVYGPIIARDKLMLTSNARVQGDLTAGTLIVAEGASFVGHCNVGPKAGEINKAAGQNMAQTHTEHKPLSTRPIDQTPQRDTSPLGDTDIDFKPPWASELTAESAA